MSILHRVKEWMGGEEQPLADAKSTRRWLATLPVNDPMKLLGELSDALQILNDNHNLKIPERLEIIYLLDEAGIGPRNRLLREYLSQSRLPSYRENALWLAIHQYWARLAAAYGFCLDQAQSARGLHLSSERLLQFVVHSLHAGRHWLKWRMLRYAVIDGEQWRLVARFFVVAENNKLSKQPHILYASTSTESSPQRELLKLLLLGVSACDGLLPVQIEIASRLIESVVTDCDWSDTQSPSMAFCFDLLGDFPPMRIQGAPAGPGVWRFFAGQKAIPSLELIRSEAARGFLKAGVQLGGDYPLRQVMSAAEHLQHHWANPLPERRSAREPSYSRIEVIHGFAEVVRHFVKLQHGPVPVESQPLIKDENVIEVSAPPSEQDDLAMSPTEQSSQRQESWVVQNISESGLGALVTLVSGDWLRVGQLIALAFQENASFWKLAVVRRLHQTHQGGTYVGLEILAQKVAPARIRLSGVQLQEDEFSLVLDGRAGPHLKLLTRVGTLDAATDAELDCNPRCSVRVKSWIEKGDSFDLALCDKKS